MKIQDIICEDVDMSFWKEKDRLFNSDALAQAEKQEKRQKILRKLSNEGTPVFRKPSRQNKGKFTTKPPKDRARSPGWRGNLNTRTKAGIVDPKLRDKLLNTNPY